MNTEVRTHRLGILLVLTALLGLPLVASGATHTVQVLDPRNFSPNDLTIEVGDTVRWVNAAGGAAHDVTADDFSWRSVTASSFTFQMTFNSVEEILYFCTVHSVPASQGGTRMNGRINVVTAAAAELELQSVDATDGTYHPGDSLTIDSTIHNSGDAATGSFTITYFASTDNTIDETDPMLGSQEIPDVGAGATLNHQGSVNVPGELPEGEYFIGAIISFADTNVANSTNVDDATVTFIGLFFVNPGLNDAWFNPATAGQGFFIIVFPVIKAMFVAMFTFETELPDDLVMAQLGAPEQRWFTAFGDYADNQAVLDIEITSDGVFDSPEPVVSQVPDGTLTVEFEDCASGTITYNIPSIGREGVIPIQRLADDNEALCEELNAQ